MSDLDCVGQPELGRRIPLPGTHNLRDVGGYATVDGRAIRRRTIFRADSLHRLTLPAQRELLAYGVRTVLDLRRDREVSRWPNVFAGSPGVRYARVDLAPLGRVAEISESPLESIYRAILDYRQAEIAQIFQLLSRADSVPVVIHCTAGKDRTGLIVALLLGLAGVDQETIARDYALSSEYLGPSYFDEARERAALANVPWERYRLNLVCPPHYMRRTLKYLDDRYGGVELYLRTIGLSTRQLFTLRAGIVQSPAAELIPARQMLAGRARTELTVKQLSDPDGAQDRQREPDQHDDRSCHMAARSV
jgi:protein-tyrosine phosphatase